ncbi:MAG: hypothetical protein HUU18_06510 [Phycisphaerales bacterium]|nr:hypothetical protein [Phycisphaerales bacterium]
MPLSRDHCPTCGYDLAGLGADHVRVCPECGGSFVPRARPAARSMPGVGLVLLVDVALAMLLLGVAHAFPLNSIPELGVFLLALLALIPVTGIVSFRRAQHYMRPRLDAWEEWILSLIVVLAGLLSGGFVMFYLSS